MAVIPKRTKYRRPHRLSYEGEARGNRKVSFGEYGLEALEGAWITQQTNRSCPCSDDSLHEAWW